MAHSKNDDSFSGSESGSYSASSYYTGTLSESYVGSETSQESYVDDLRVKPAEKMIQAPPGMQSIYSHGRAQ
jgi:hypothetical protein